MISILLAALAQDTLPPPTRLPVVEVTVTRDAARSPLELPYSITTVYPDSMRPGLRHLALDEMLLVVPGVAVSNRFNPTQDPRISIRGFGARSAFGVRGVRVMRDGIPLTVADGQTPVDYLDLESVGAVEVIRGSAGSLYGNAAGGVVDLRSAPVPVDPLAVQARVWAGGGGMQRYTISAGGSRGDLGYQGNVSRTTSDGSRAYSRQRVTHLFARGEGRLGNTGIAAQFLGFDMPLAENPGSLTAEEFFSDPAAADPLSVSRRARKEVSQAQAGLTATRPLGGEGELSVAVHGGMRDLYNPLPFALVGVDRRTSGATIRASLPFPGTALVPRLSAGIDMQRQDDERSEWSNCNATPPLTVPTANCPVVGEERGSVRRRQQELVTSAGPFVRGELALGDRVSASAGVRADVVNFTVRDRVVTTDAGNSGARRMHAVSPMAGIVIRTGLLTAVHASVSTAFETPTATELGNKPDGSTGVNPDLRPQHSQTFEVGVKGAILPFVSYDVALFSTAVRDELIPFEIAGGGGRRYFRNAGRTSRRGAELGLRAERGPLMAMAAYTFSDYSFTDFMVGAQDFAGNAIPGIAPHVVQGSVTMRSAAAFLTVEGMASGRIHANDSNTDDVAGYGVMHARAGALSLFDRPWLSPVFGVQNLLDRRYAASVSVNASARAGETPRYYEPAPGRTFFAGLSVGLGR
jgi:iron complex outermembrane recepter protein